MKKVLLVGEGGYVGGAVKAHLEKFDNYSVDIVSSLNGLWSEKSFANYDTVYNVSGLAHANARRGSEEEYYEVNGRLPIAIALKAKAEGVQQFINMSSSVVYGDFSKLYETKNITLETVPSEPTIYGKSKMMAERGLEKLVSESFSVVSIRPPLIYGENARDNFPRLVKFAKTFPLFPDVANSQSMIYIDNFCELIRLIIDNNSSGIFYPQEKEYIHTSKLVKDIAIASGNKLYLTKIFNPLLKLFEGRIGFIHKALGSMTYDKSMSNHFDWEYCIVDYEDSIRRIVQIK